MTKAKLNPKLVEEITRTAVQTVIEHLNKEKEKQEKEKQDRRLRNVLLLLKHYRGLELHCEKLENDLEVFQNTSIQDLDINEISLESIEAIKQSKTKSLAMVYFVRGKMEAFKRSCSEDELKYFRVLEKKYLSKKKYSTREIAELENIDERTVRRYIDRAVESLPVIFFGIEAIKFEK